MGIDKLNLFRLYFKGFDELKSADTRSIGRLKVISYFVTLGLLPMICAIVLGIKKLVRRIKQKNNEDIDQGDRNMGHIFDKRQGISGLNLPVKKSDSSMSRVSVASFIPAPVVNIMNSCYQNSIFQCLFNIPEFSEVIRKAAFENNPNQQNREMAQCMWNMYHAYAANDQDLLELCSRTTRKIMQQRGWLGERAEAQQDAREFLDHFLTSIGFDVTTLLRIQGLEGTEAVGVPAVRSNDPITQVIVDLKTQNNHLGRLVKENFEGEVADPSNAWRDPGGMQHVHYMNKKLFMGQPPKVLPISIQRFKQNDRNVAIKRNEDIEAPNELDLSEFVDDELGDKSVPARYRLVGYITHHGSSTEGGHYTANVLRPDGKWYFTSDSLVRLAVDEKNDRKQGYVYFYERVDEKVSR